MERSPRSSATSILPLCFAWQANFPLQLHRKCLAIRIRIHPTHLLHRQPITLEVAWVIACDSLVLCLRHNVTAQVKVLCDLHFVLILVTHSFLLILWRTHREPATKYPHKFHLLTSANVQRQNSRLSLFLLPFNHVLEFHHLLSWQQVAVLGDRSSHH